MPKGVRKKKDVAAEMAAATGPAEVVTSSPAVTLDAPKKSEHKMTPNQEAIAESRKVLEIPLDPGQAFFESPDGHIIIGEGERDRAWCRAANGGQGMWINKMR